MELVTQTSAFAGANQQHADSGSHEVVHREGVVVKDTDSGSLGSGSWCGGSWAAATRAGGANVDRDAICGHPHAVASEGAVQPMSGAVEVAAPQPHAPMPAAVQTPQQVSGDVSDAYKAAWRPFARGEAWHCCNLFQDCGGESGSGLYRSCPEPELRPAQGLDGAHTRLRVWASAICTIAFIPAPTDDELHAGRTALKVSLPECNYVHYVMPSLRDDELATVRQLESDLQSATYAPGAFVPIYWDTETTGLGAHKWWTQRCSRIVQVAAHTGAAHGGREFEVRINPWPVQMEAGAAFATGMSNSDVWQHGVPPQVRLLPVALSPVLPLLLSVQP